MGVPARLAQVRPPVRTGETSALHGGTGPPSLLRGRTGAMGRVRSSDASGPEAGQNWSDQALTYPVSLAQLSLTRSFQVPLAGSPEALTV